MSEEQGQLRTAEVAEGINDVNLPSKIQPTAPAKENSEGAIEDAIKVEDAVENSADADGDSEAETLIQSPEKSRNIVDNAPALLPVNGENSSINISNAPAKEVQSRKRKRSVNEVQSIPHSSSPSRRSSPLSSPIARLYSGDSDSDHRARKEPGISVSKKSKRNGVRDHSLESGSSTHRKRRPSDLSSHAYTHARDKQSMDAGERRETRSATYPRPSDDERSPSPHLTARREHRRGASTQLGGQDFERKRRGRPPLINTRRNRSAERTGSPESDDDSPAPPRSALHKFSGHDHDTMSPAKTGPRKWRDKNGRTWVARAANNDDLEGVKSKLAERPEDLNLADNAGNSPLQIAALEGFIDIVEYLLLQGCEVDSRNIDKDTPLIDAVENGHVEVVRLLLTHGANPRLGNAKGDEPYELVHQDDENYGEIRRLLADAKERDSGRHRAQGQADAKDREGGSSSRAASAASPRDSPPAGPRSPPPAASSRRRTGRSESTRNDLLWQANTPENLTKLAGRGDTQGVANILNILQKANTESLIAAAKAGHGDVLEYLLAMGAPDPDPDPIRALNPGYNTPLLAAIGRGHVGVVKLLVDQAGFNPTRRFMGKTYAEFAEERKGQNWKQECEVLKAAFDKYVASKGRKQSSPRKTRDMDKVRPRPPRTSLSPVTQKTVSSSPTMTHKSLPTKSTESSPNERRKAGESNEKKKIAGARHELPESSSIAVSSDLDQSVAVPKKTHRVRRSQSDLPTPRTLENEAPYRRRRLVTGKEHRRTKSSAPESGSSGEESKDMIEVKQEDKPTPSLKRSRSSHTPDPKQNGKDSDDDKTRTATKKRRTVESSPEETRVALPDPVKLPSPVPSQKTSDASEMEGVEDNMTEAVTVNDSTIIPSHEMHILDGETVKSPDKELVKSQTDGDHFGPNVESEDKAEEAVEAEKIPETQSPVNYSETVSTVEPAASVATQPDSALQQGVIAETTLADQEEDATKGDTDGCATTAAAAAEEIEAANQARETARLREAELLREAQEKAELEARRAESEALARQREEEEMRLQLEIRLREEAELKERYRIEALPKMLARCAEMINNGEPLVRSHPWLKKKLLPIFTVKTCHIDPDCSAAIADDEWAPSFQIAGLFATKDLSLQSYTSMEKRPVTKHQQAMLWRVARHALSYDFLSSVFNIDNEERKERERQEAEKFMNMEGLFWVQITEFMSLVPQHPHLLGLSLPTRPCSLKTYKQVMEAGQNNTPPGSVTRLTNGAHSTSSPNGNSVQAMH